MLSIAVILALFHVSEVPETPFLNQAMFDLTLYQPLVINRSPVAIQAILQRISSERNVAILLDRRIDPSSIVNVEIDTPYLDEGIGRLSQQLNADTLVVADTLFVFPKGKTGSLRSYAHELQTQLEEICQSDRIRLGELVKRRAVYWDMLSTPQEIVAQICQSYTLKIENIDQLPHDLWGQGNISHPNCVEALLLVLVQFELSFEWVDAATIKLVPLPETPKFEQFHRPKKSSVTEAIQVIQKNWDVELTQLGTRLKIVAPLETHEAIAEMLGERKPRRSPNANAHATSLVDTPFSLKMQREPFLSLLKLLEKQGFEVHYDEAVLKDAGVDLMQKITLEVQQVKIHELLKQPCKEVNLQVRIDGNAIHLEPVKK